VDVYGFRRGIDAIRAFSADAAGLFSASEELLVWGWLHATRRAESNLFAGPTILALAAFAVFAARPFAVGAEDTRRRLVLRRLFAGLFVLLAIATALPMVYGSWRLTIGGVRLLSIARADKPFALALVAFFSWMSVLPAFAAAARRRSPLAFYALAAFAMWVFALGPDPEMLGHRVLYQAPYGWLMRLPGFDGLRVPARFWMMALVCLGVLAALAVDRLSGRTRRIVASAALVGLLLDGWPRVFIVLAEPDRRPAPPGVFARLDLPMTEDRDALALYQQTLERVPLYNGFSGYNAPHQYAMRELLESADVRILQALASRGSLGVVIDHPSDADGRYRRFVMAYPGASLYETHETWSSYRLPANGGGDLLPAESGRLLTVKSLDAFPSAPHTPRAVDGDLTTRWSGGVQRAAADFTIELPQPAHVGQVVTEIGEFWADFPMRLQLDVSPDGSQWETVYLGSGALQAFYGGLRHPKQVPLVYSIDRDNVRFIRMKQLGWGPHDWSIAELRVLK
jgi:hypothetical protein